MVSGVPFSSRTVLFLTKETDAKERERDFLVIGFTSTDPKDLARRWAELPRSKEFRHMPAARKPHGQVWVHWEQAYRWLQPYINVGVGSLIQRTVLPDAEEIQANLTDAYLTLKIKYAGLAVTHEGPLPAGVLGVPLMAAMSLEEDRSGGSDLARERQACRQLKVLHHHAKLFKKDLGRWPAEVT